jgi:predicted permease
MKAIRRIFVRLANLLLRRRDEERLRAEIEEHIALQTEEYIRAGISAAEGRRQALVKFGAAEAIKESYRDQASLPLMESAIADVKYGLRSLRHSPAFALISIMILGLGVGANTAVFTLADTFLWRSLSVPQPERLVRYMFSSAGVPTGLPASTDLDFPLSGPIFDELRKEQRACTDLFGWTDSHVLWSAGAEAQTLPAALVTGGAFPVLGIKPALGRLLDYPDDRPGGGPQGWVANISYDFWQARFHGDPVVLGKTLVLEHIPVTVVGVLPKGFHGVLIGSNPRVVLPWEFDVQVNGAGSDRHRNNSLSFTVMGRLRPGVTYGQARADSGTIKESVIKEAVPAKIQDDFFRMLTSRLDVRPGGTGFSDFNRQYRKPLLLMQLLVLAVLLVVGLNLSTLFMARAGGRRHEMAVRAALGARRWRLLLQLLIEGLLLAIPGSIVALVVGAWGSRVLFTLASRQAPDMTVDLHPGLVVLAANLGFALCAVLISSCWPAWKIRRLDLSSAMESGRQGHLGERRSRFVRWLLPAQVALSLLLVAVAGLFVASFTRILVQPSGFRPQGVLLADTNFYRRPETGQQKVALYRRMLIELRQIPGVETASAARVTLMNGDEADEPYYSQDAAGQRHEDRALFENRVAPGLFDTLGMRLLAGRDFSDSDSEQTEPVCILTSSAARFFFPTSSALGGFITNDNAQERPVVHYRVVGMVTDAKYDTLHEAAPRTIFFPYTQSAESLDSLTLVLRGPDTAKLAAGYRETMHQFVPDSPVPAPVTLQQRMLVSVSSDRLFALLSGYLGGLALLLSCIALYGVMSWNISLRTAEVGIRMALGATPYRVVGMILGEALVVVAAGVLAGLAATAGTTRWLASFLFDTRPLDPRVLLAAAGSMLAATMFAAWLPSRRASAIDPVAALRAE